MNQRTIKDYDQEHTERIRASCLYLATVLGDLMNEIVIVGGLVPSLLIDQSGSNADIEAHAGTADLDIGFQLAILKESKYTAFSCRLREANFLPDINLSGNQTRHRWRLSGDKTVLVDFLIPPVESTDKGGSIRNLEKDFAAIVIPGLSLAFKDKVAVQMTGRTIMGEKAARDIWVCGPGSFVILKALALRQRGKLKDAYDIYYFLKNFGNDVEDASKGIQPFLDEPLAVKALRILKEDFTDPEAIGPIRAARFISGGSDEDIQADAAGYVRAFLTGIPSCE